MLLIVTVLLYSVATLGLNIQFGYAGVLNFAGASFFGVGACTSAVLGTSFGQKIKTVEKTVNCAFRA